MSLGLCGYILEVLETNLLSAPNFVFRPRRLIVFQGLHFLCGQVDQAVLV